MGMSGNSAAEAATNYWALFAMVFPFGLFLFIAGLLVYRKKFPGYLAMDRILPGKPSLATTYLGAWIMLLPMSHIITEAGNEVLLFLYAAAAFACFAIGIGGAFWMPRILQPKWMKESDRLEARGEDLYSTVFLNGGSEVQGSDGPRADGPRADGLRAEGPPANGGETPGAGNG